MVGLGTYCVNLDYDGVTVANVTVTDVSIRAMTNSSVHVFGYLRKDLNRSDIIETIIPNKLMRGIFTRDYQDLPFTLRGCQYADISLSQIDRNASQLLEPPTLFTDNTAALAVQYTLANRIVPVGRMYRDLGPRGPNGSLAIAELFKNIPVVGYNGLYDVLKGLRLKMDWNILRTEVPISVFLSNPFDSAISVGAVDMAVYLPPFLMQRPIGWVSPIRPGRDGNGYPLIMPPGYHESGEDLPPLGNGSSMNGIFDDVKPQFKFKFNMALFANIADAVRQISTAMKQNQFRISLRGSEIMVKIGRMVVRFHDLSEEALTNMPFIPEETVKKLGWKKIFQDMFGDGWKMVDSFLV
jgi:hypothetical protein